MTPPAPENESPLEQWLLAYDSLLAGDLAALPPMAAESVASVNLQQAQVCLQMLELDRLSQQLDPSSSQAVSDDAGQRFQRFRLIRKLGEGGFGVVFLAEDPTLQRLVAIKVPQPETLVTEERRQRFLAESRTVAQLAHPHIVAIHEAGQFGPFCFQVLPYCAGGSLADWLTRHGQNGVPWETAIGWIEQVGDSIQYAHEHGVWHCDLKPSNILLVPVDPAVSCDDKASTACDGAAFRLQVSDFGLARTVTSPSLSEEPSAPLRFRYSALGGSLPYMAPEQCHSGLSPISVRTDVFGLGAVLYEILTGTPPFPDSGELRPVGEPEASLDQLPSNVPPRVKNALRRALQMDPAKRFPSIREFIQALRDVTPAAKPKRSWLLVAGLSLVTLGGLWGLNSLRTPDAPQPLATQPLSSGALFYREGNVFESPWQYDGRAPMTFELWAKPQHPHGIMLAVSGMFSIWSDNGQLTVGPKVSVMMNDRDCLIIHSPKPLTVETWHHLALVVHDSRIEFFQDGRRMNCDALMDTAAGTIPLQELPPVSMQGIWPDVGLTVGSNGLGSSPQHRYPFHGSIREIRITYGVRYSKDFEPQLRLPLEADTVALFHLEPDLQSVPDETGTIPPLRRVPQPLLP